MLGKLMKYEWRGYRLPLIVMLIVLSGTTLLTCAVILTINPIYDEVFADYSLMAFILSILLYYFGLIGCATGMALIIAIRFYKTCYTDQGYLTHTLPVTPTQLLNAKIIVSILVYLMLMACIAVTLFILAAVGGNHAVSVSENGELFRDILAREWPAFLREFEETFGISLNAWILYLAGYTIISCAASIVTILGCVSLGQLYAKHRVVGAIAAYFIVQSVLQLIGYLCSMPVFSHMAKASYYTESVTVSGLFSPYLSLMLAISVAIAAGMYFVNLHMMTKRLNLE